MQISAAFFTDPSKRAGLQEYYESMKADAINAIKACEADPDFKSTIEGTITMPDGTTSTLQGNLITAEKMEKSFVSFDKWLETTQQVYESQQKIYEMAQKRMDMLKEQHPDTSSGVRATFAHNGELLAYINQDGSIATSNGGDKYVRAIIDKANELNLNGPARADYLQREVQAALTKQFGNDLSVESYNAQTSPTKREFSKMWHQNFDIDAHYKSALIEAQDSIHSAQKWFDQMQANIKKMHDFLIGYQSEIQARGAEEQQVA